MHSIICGSAFSIKSLNEKAYEVNVQFLDVDSHSLSDKSFTFLQEVSVEEGTIWDVFTKNGTCQNKLPFSNKDPVFAETVAKKLPESLLSPLVCVLDLKDPSTGYLPNTSSLQSIAKSEAAVCGFFQNNIAEKQASKCAQKMHTLFKSSLPVDFIICEGSLKVELLQQGGFTDHEVEYFQTSRSGKDSFCVMAEYFMNGFKLGDTAYSPSKASFSAQKFIKPISTKFPDFHPYKTSAVFYPPQYKEIYSSEGEFAATLKPVFSAAGDFDTVTEITTLTVEKW